MKIQPEVLINMTGCALRAVAAALRTEFFILLQQKFYL